MFGDFFQIPTERRPNIGIVIEFCCTASISRIQCSVYGRYAAARSTYHARYGRIRRHAWHTVHSYANATNRSSQWPTYECPRICGGSTNGHAKYDATNVHAVSQSLCQHWISVSRLKIRMHFVHELAAVNG